MNSKIYFSDNSIQEEFERLCAALSPSQSCRGSSLTAHGALLMAVAPVFDHWKMGSGSEHILKKSYDIICIRGRMIEPFIASQNHYFAISKLRHLMHQDDLESQEHDPLWFNELAVAIVRSVANEDEIYGDNYRTVQEVIDDVISSDTSKIKKALSFAESFVIKKNNDADTKQVLSAALFNALLNDVDSVIKSE